MGCLNSVDAEMPRKKEWVTEFHALGFDDGEVQALYNTFVKCDADGSGQISLRELSTFLNVEHTSWYKKIFSLFDEDHSGEIDFREYVVSLFNYCTSKLRSLSPFTRVTLKRT